MTGPGDRSGLEAAQGVNAPSGYAVAMAFQTQPHSAARHLSLDI